MHTNGSDYLARICLFNLFLWEGELFNLRGMVLVLVLKECPLCTNALPK